MTPAWKDLVRKTLRDRGMEQQELAEAIGSSKSAITKMWAAQTSKLVEDICRVLEIPLPLSEVGQDDDELDSELRKLDDEKRLKLLKLLRSGLL